MTHKSGNRFKKIYFYSSWLISLLLTLYACAHLPGKVCERAMFKFAALLGGIAVAGFIGSVIESKLRGANIIMIIRPLISFARLPEASGRAFLIALFSGTAATIMLAEAGEAGEITRKEMFLSFFFSRFPAMFSSSLKIIFPIIAAIGTVGLFYYLTVYGIELVIFLIVILYSRFRSDNKYHYHADFSRRNKQFPPGELLQRSFNAASSLCLRFLKVALPCYLLTVLLVESGFISQIQDFLPKLWQNKVSPDILLIAGSRLGGMLSAAGVIAEVANAHRLTLAEIIIALLIGKMILIPIKTLRSSLPVMIGFFHGLDGVWMAFIINAMRLIISLAAACLIYVIFL